MSGTGSKKKKQAIRQQEAVLLPHDGPLFRYHQQDDTPVNPAVLQPNNGALVVNQDQDAIFEAAVELLSVTKDPTCLTDDQTENRHIYVLLHKLHTSQQIQHQLGALQLFKTTMLQRHEKEQIQLETEESQKSTSTTTMALYRILLEWSASYQTPLPLRKTILGVLDAMGKINLLSSSNSIALVQQQQTILVQVLESVTSNVTSSDDENRADSRALFQWKQPIHSLDVILTISLTHDATIRQIQKSGKETTGSKKPELAARHSSFSFFTLFLEKVWIYLEWFASTQLLPQLASKTLPRQQQEMDDREQNNQSINVDSLVEEGVRFTLLIKTLLETLSEEEFSDDSLKTEMTMPSSDCLQVLSELTWTLMACPSTPTGSLVVISMAHGQLVQAAFKLPWVDSTRTNQSNKNVALEWKQQLRSRDLVVGDSNLSSSMHALPDLPRVVFMQGLVSSAATDDDLFVPETNESQVAKEVSENPQKQPFVWVFLEEFILLVSTAVDPEVRLSALKGLRALTHRCASWVQQSENERGFDLSRVVDNLLDCVLAAWENPPTRKMASAIPMLFESTLDLSFLLSSPESKACDTGESEKEKDHLPQSLVQRFLEQPPNRKGRYKALELLLPRVGAKRLLQASSHDQNHSSTSTFWTGSNLLEDLLAGIAEVGNNEKPIADLWAKLLNSLLVEEEKERPGTKLPSSWLGAWVPSLGQSLTDVTDSRRRKQVAAFCLPRIKTICGETRQEAVAEAFSTLIDYVHLRLSPQHANLSSTPSLEHETFMDRQLWTICEIVRCATTERLFDHKVGQHQELERSVSSAIPMRRLRGALVHFSPLIRLVAFQSMNSIVKTYTDQEDTELDLWKGSLPYAVKNDSKEFRASLLYSLLSFMDRLSMSDGILHRGATSSGGDDIEVKTSSLFDFVVHFLLDDLFSCKTAYPGSVLSKESFALTLLEGIMVFSCRECDMVWESKLLPKTGAMFHRRRDVYEEKVISAIRRAILSDHIVSTCFSLLQSPWDGTRKWAFMILSMQIRMARIYEISVPPRFLSITPEKESRAFFLVSSPRQREADTGARLIALSCVGRESFGERLDYLTKLLTVLETRTLQMKESLGSILTDNENLLRGRQLPLAHGVIQAITFAVESRALRDRGDSLPQDLLRGLSIAMSRALQVSLSVVADLKEGEQLEGLADDATEYAPESNTFSATGKINPGSIGANGIFASIARLDETEYQRRLASQRIVMGSWLLMKEACNASATMLTTMENIPDEAIVNQTGILLIDTLTTLKHTGAAYAAHTAFQQITQLSLQHKHLKHLPLLWRDRLLEEITQLDKVRDSTLRRSTGYALGFLSIMRSDVALRKAPRVLCKNLIESILQLSMPSRERLSKFSETIFGTNKNESSGLLTSKSGIEQKISHQYTVRTRIHALNVLRMLLLDAPLGKDIQPFIGDAISVAIVGYVDSEWGVRNSSTMVFAASLLRVVDADKNASNSEAKSSNAITLAELFRSYPHLAGFLRAVLEASLAGKFIGWETNDLPPILPVLILLYRVQPSTASDIDSIALFAPFIPKVIQCLSHKHIAIRKAASRALGNMASSHRQSPTFLGSLLTDAFKEVKNGRCWNARHGSLMMITELIRTAWILVQESWHGEYTELLLTLMRQERVPPICTAEAIQSLDSLCETYDEMREPLENGCFAVLLRACGKKMAAHDKAGNAELARVASSVATALVARRIPRTVQDLSADFGKISCLIECNQIDGRVAAVKAMKKRIYDIVDDLMILSESDPVAASQMSQQLENTLVSALKTEIARDMSSSSTDSAHPPTLRRLSRCLLECVEVQQKLGFATSSTLVSTCEALRYWATKLSAEEFKGGPAKPYDENTSAILGNTAELSARTFRRPEELESLSYFIQRLSSPDLSWKLRCSSAMALRALFSSRPETSASPVLWSTGCVLLQDEDDDVRYVSTQTMNFSGVADAATVPEQTLVELALNPSRRKQAQSALLQSLMEKLLLMGSETEKKISMLARELLTSSEGSAPPDQLANIGTERKIFEEEGVNSFGEEALDIQIRVALIVREGDTTSNPEAGENARVLCDQILAALCSLPPMILGETTRSNKLFARLHSIILGCACLSYVDGMRKESLADKVRGTNWCDCHPLFREALEALVASTEGGREQATSKVLDGCFLIPRGK